MFMIAFQQSLASLGFTKNLQFRCRHSRFRLQCIEGFPDTFLYFLSPILILLEQQGHDRYCQCMNLNRELVTSGPFGSHFVEQIGEQHFHIQVSCRFF